MPIKSIFNFNNYLALWLIYYSQGAVWGEGTIYSSYLLVILMVWSITIYVKCLVKYTKLPISLVCLNILLASYILYGLVPVINHQTLYIPVSGTEIPPFSYMKQALVSIIPIYVFYYYSKKDEVSIRKLSRLVLIFLLVMILCFFTEYTKLLQNALMNNSSKTEFTNNLSYNFIYLIPYLYLLKRKSSALFVLITICIFLLIGMKRGAIIIGVIILIPYIRNFLKSGSKHQRQISYLLISIFVIATVIIAIDVYNNSPYFQSRIENTIEGKTGRRDEIYGGLLDYFINNTSVFQFFFGSGANSTIKHSFNFAHNDWIEILINQGIFGFILLLIFYVAMYLDVKEMKKYNKMFYKSFIGLYIIILLKTFFSMSICNMPPYITLLLGYYLAILNSYKHHKYYENGISANIGGNTSIQCREVSAKMR